MWECNNKKCGKKFPIAGKLIINKKGYTVQKACCPYCESIDFKNVSEKFFE